VGHIGALCNVFGNANVIALAGVALRRAEVIAGLLVAQLATASQIGLGGSEGLVEATAVAQVQRRGGRRRGGLDRHDKNLRHRRI